MTKDEALRHALEALELVSIEFVCNGAHHAKKDRHEWLDPCPIVDRYKDAITAIKAALEAKDEPDQYAMDIECTKCGATQSGVLTVHTAPPQRTWVGLTDEEREVATGWSVEHIEAKLKEKNT